MMDMLQFNFTFKINNMATSYELEQQLKEAKHKEKQEQLQKELEENTKKYKGKAFCTHQIGRKDRQWGRQMIDFNCHIVDDVVIKNDKICTIQRSVRYFRDKSGNFNFTVNAFNLPYEIDTWYFQRCKYEISVEMFENILIKATSGVDIIADEFRKFIPSDDYITIGDSQREGNEVELILQAGVPTIKISDKNIAEMLNWYYHPLLIGNDLLINNQYSKQIVINIANKLEEKARSWGGSIMQRDYPRIQKLREFVEKTNWIE